MSYGIYFAAYYIIGFVNCISYMIYNILTDNDDDFVGFWALMLFFFWPIVIPVALFVWIQNKFKIIRL